MKLKKRLRPIVEFAYLAVCVWFGFTCFCLRFGWEAVKPRKVHRVPIT